MVTRTVDALAASRLHFGLISFGHKVGRQFGGAGVMIQQPALRIRVTAAPAFSVKGAAAERAEAAVRRWAQWRQVAELPSCELQLIESPPLHVGLGSGTQMSLCVASALDAFTGREIDSVPEMAVALGRGQRSAIGSYGFSLGGLIVEPGKTAEEPISPLERRVALPPDWRFVLICPRGTRGLYGGGEADVFRRLPPVPQRVSEAMLREVREHMLPAVDAGLLTEFGESVHRFGHQAGLCYETVQGRPYCSRRAEELVHAIRGRRVAGAGQSSWGPTVFAICGDSDQAEWLLDSLARQRLLEDAETVVSPVCNEGAKITRATAV